jgi:hypothetical protein
LRKYAEFRKKFQRTSGYLESISALGEILDYVDNVASRWREITESAQLSETETVAKIIFPEDYNYFSEGARSDTLRRIDLVAPKKTFEVKREYVESRFYKAAEKIHSLAEEFKKSLSSYQESIDKTAESAESTKYAQPESTQPKITLDFLEKNTVIEFFFIQPPPSSEHYSLPRVGFKPVTNDS